MDIFVLFRPFIDTNTTSNKLGKISHSLVGIKYKLESIMTSKVSVRTEIGQPKMALIFRTYSYFFVCATLVCLPTVWTQ